MLTYAQAILLGLAQGFSELFPISSLGHSVLIPALLGWPIDLSSDQFLGFVVLTHLATALVLLFFFWRDWMRIIIALVYSLKMRSMSDPYARLGWLLLVSTIPAGLLGLLLQRKLQDLFVAATLVAVVLILNGLILWAADTLRRKHLNGAIERMSLLQAFAVGIAQCLALIPGFSRTGVTMIGGLLSGLSYEEAARYAFLLATPLIFAAAVLKVPAVFHQDTLGPSLVGAFCAAAASFISVKFLVKYFQTKTLRPFAYYCIAAGLISLVVLWVR